MLIHQIQLAQNSDEKAMLDLIETFSPLLEKYARVLGDVEDSKSDLTLFFIELILKIKHDKMRTTGDGAIVLYIEKAVKYHYIALSKKKRSQVNHEIELPEQAEHFLPEQRPIYSTFGLLDTLSSFEKMVVERTVLQGYSSADVARETNCTRQYINQVKKRALSRLESEII